MGNGTSDLSTAYKRKNLGIMNKHPVWETVARGKSLGFMKMKRGSEWRGGLSISGKHSFTALGVAEVVKGDGNMTYEEALESANKWFNEVKGTFVGYTLRNCINDYVEKLEIDNSKDSAKRTKQRLNKHIIEDMMNTRVNNLTVYGLKKWHREMVVLGDDEIKRKSKDSANRVLSQLKAALNNAYNMEIVNNPIWNKVKVFENVSSGKVSLLTDRQVAAIFNATKGGFHNLCKALALTGARYGELNKARVKDFNKKERTLRLRTKKGRGGTLRERDAILSDAAVSFFKKLSKDSLPSAYLITRDDGEPWGTSHQTRPWRKAVRDTAKNKKKADRVPANAVLYDLRHYNISQGMMAGIPMKLIADNCGTSVAMLVKTYAKATEKYKREAFNSVSIG